MNTATPRWTVRPEGSTWGDFGPDDQLGRLNLVTREKVLQGIAEVKEGISFCLSLPLTLPGGTALNPRRQPPKLRPIGRDGYPAMNFPTSLENPKYTDLICDDMIEFTMQYSTQWDSLAHVGQFFDVDGDGKPERVYYNGFRAGVDVVGPYDFEAGTELPEGATLGANRLGIENMAAAGVQGRAVMVDFDAHYGRKHHPVSYDDLMRMLEKDRVEPEKGDFFVMHPGFAEILIEGAGNPDPKLLHNSCAALDGRDRRTQNWITDTGVVAMIADNLAVEFSPSREDEHGHNCSKLPLHEHCLFRLGVNLGELWNLGELNAWLKANGRNRFLLTAPPLRYPGAVGSPVTPIGTV